MLDLGPSRIIGAAAGIAILALGYFVYHTAPRSPLHRLFFAFAAADGVSTLAFEIAYMGGGLTFQLHAYLLYAHAFIAFLGLLVAFGLQFPLPLVPTRMRRATMWGIALATGGIMGLHAWDPHLFWTGRMTPDGVLFEYQPAGRVLLAAFVLATAAVVLRVTILLFREPSESHRRQAAYVLGGITLGYAPYATTTFVYALGLGADRTFFSSRPDVAFVYLATAASILVTLAAAVLLLRERRPERQQDRNIVLASFGIVLATTLVALWLPNADVSNLLQVLGLLAYPILVAYAIFRYEILDITAHVRRTAMVSLVGASFAAIFLLFDATLSEYLEARFQAFTDLEFLSVLAAAGATALVILPVSRLIRPVTRRIAPELDANALNHRRLEIYRHSLEGVLADGVVDVQESRVLANLRQTLGITPSEHETIARTISRRSASG